MHRLIRVLEATDPELAEHGMRTAQLARNVAVQMKLASDVVDRIEAAASLHDIGKLFINRDILDKPGPPTEREWVELRRHPRLGFELLRGRVADSVARIVLCHHERCDGLGYPSRIAGGDVPVEAGVLQVADAFDAITSIRPYQPALPVSFAVAELKRCSGSQFDPRAVRAILELIEKSGWELAGDDLESLDDEVAV